MLRKKDFHKVIIGRSEGLSIVDLDISDIPAKTDTGAYRSAIHADKVKLNKEGTLSFILLNGHPICGTMTTDINTEMTTTNFKEVWIANSFGHREKRFEVKLRVKLGPKVFTAPFTLADRSKKNYPVLLGRKLLSDRFLVDSAESSLSRARLKQKYGISFPKDEEEGR